MNKEFYNLDEIQKYYDNQTNTYIFKEDGEYIDLVIFDFNLNVEANIDACDIDALDIKAHNIHAWNIDARYIDTKNIKANNINAYDIYANNINAWNIDVVNNIKAGNIEANYINALDINYHAVCFAYKNIKCKSIKGRRENHKHFALDGKIEVLEDE